MSMDRASLLGRRQPVYFIGPDRTPDFRKPSHIPDTDKVKFFKGDWRECWPRDFQVGDRGGTAA